MESLRQRILKDGKCLDSGTLKVDSFINQQIDPQLMMEMGEEFARRFASSGINKILTGEGSGIAPATMTGWVMKVPVVFAKKNKPSTMEHELVTKVFSFTKNREYEVCVSSEFLHEGDKVLFIDDFLANGNAAKGIINLIHQAGAEIVGMGFLIEKEFQLGRGPLEKMGIHVESLAVIESLENGKIKIR